MLQRKSCTPLVAILLLLSSFQAVFSAPGESSPLASTTAPADRVISLSPAATDLLLAMGAANRLVGVSTFDTDRRIAGLPRIGDYENVDWERIATLSPGHMVVQMAPERLPAGFKERAAAIGIKLYNAHIDRLADVTREARSLGDAVGLHEAATALVERIETAVKSAQARAAGKPRVRTLICTSDDGLGVAGADTYLNDLLVLAGGENVLGSDQRGYVQLDREALLSLAPDVIICLSPSPTAAQREVTARTWSQLSAVPAVREKRVLMIEDPWCLTPGAHVADLAERFAAFLHP